MPTRAVIDIGTNSVKLLVADVSRDRADPKYEGSEQTRLGAGFYKTHRLQPQAIQKTADAVGAFADKAKTFKPASLHIVATSAARDALNQTELVESIERVTGKNLAVISGEQEAE